MNLKKLLMGAAVLASAVMFAGCGGGGGGGSVAGAGSGFLFLTDDVNANYDHVFATVLKVDLVGASGLTTVYDGTASGGQVVDLRSLHDSTGQKFMLLSGFTAPSGVFTGVTVTVASTVSMVPKGGTNSTTYTFAGSSGGTMVFTSNFATPQDITKTKNVALDFNLANWSVSGTTVSATGGQYVQFAPPEGADDPGHQVGARYPGQVSGLTGTAPVQSFTISHDRFSITVVTSASTVLANSDGSSSPTLANGERVLVSGTFDPATKTLTATSVKIVVGSVTSPPARISGLVTAANLAGNTLTLDLKDCDGLQPSSMTITVNVGASTTFQDGSGVTDTEAQFFANITPNTTRVEAEGSISNSVMTATSLRIEGDGSGDGGGSGGGGGSTKMVDDAGVVSSLDAKAGTFSIKLSDWQGGWQQKGSTVAVVTTASTKYFENGASESAATFFGNLKNGVVVEVRGSLDLGTKTITASELRLGKVGR